jgi:hypothetical protein
MGGLLRYNSHTPPTSSSDRHCTMMCAVLVCRFPNPDLGRAGGHWQDSMARRTGSGVRQFLPSFFSHGGPSKRLGASARAKFTSSLPAVQPANLTNDATLPESCYYY